MKYPRLLTGFVRVCREPGRLYREWRLRIRTRRYLIDMPPDLLKDAGISESQRRREMNKPFWRA